MNQDKLFTVIKWYIVYMFFFILFDLGVIILAHLDYLNDSNFGFYSYIRVASLVTFFILILCTPQTEETKQRVREFVISSIKKITFQKP